MNPAPHCRIWHGIEATDPPVERHNHPALLATARAMLSTREKRFPGLIASGTRDRASAEAEIATFRAIVADWQWIDTGEGAPARADTISARREALDSSISTIAEIAREQGRFSDELADQAQCVIALRWHLEPGRKTHWFADLTHELRRRANTKEAAHVR